MTIWTLGDAVVDLLPRDNMQFEACAGGAPFNVAIGVARLGHDSGFIGRVGNDAFGRFLHQTLVTAQVDTKSLEFDPKRHTSTVLVSLDPDGERQFDFLVNPSADQFLSPATLAQAMAATRRAAGTLSFDINLRPQMWGNQTLMFDLVSEFARQSDILKRSEEELLRLTRTDDFNSACGALATTQRGALSAFPNNQQLSRFIQSQPSLNRTINP
ncbi:PfkB family carbohydrate kinase [Citrobacter sp. Cu231]|uniref:PfkB family carbohydrate kinase n=1 Tax=Citrobacter sp. Cu231 TaxID=2985159 RepID=UPI002578B64E|nr:PfkB family carbohydrate kinase [Citrobacter sp. Cu231]MDM2745859.1 PfkB family carbohydrate kinase [Citrobacter sp. Cu231]